MTTMADQHSARMILTQVQDIPLSDDERDTLAAELQRIDDLEHILQQRVVVFWK